MKERKLLNKYIELLKEQDSINKEFDNAIIIPSQKRFVIEIIYFIAIFLFFIFFVQNAYDFYTNGGFNIISLSIFITSMFFLLPFAMDNEECYILKSLNADNNKRGYRKERGAKNLKEIHTNIENIKEEIMQKECIINLCAVYDCFNNEEKKHFEELFKEYDNRTLLGDKINEIANRKIIKIQNN